jgi:phosphotransacetylase
VVADSSYFGTMMVLLGMTDGMVSGATHTTAETIRPSLEVVRSLAHEGHAPEPDSRAARRHRHSYAPAPATVGGGADPATVQDIVNTGAITAVQAAN